MPYLSPPPTVGPGYQLLPLHTMSISPFHQISTFNLKPAINSLMPVSGEGSAAPARFKSVAALCFLGGLLSYCCSVQELGGHKAHTWPQVPEPASEP